MDDGVVRLHDDEVPIDVDLVRRLIGRDLPDLSDEPIVRVVGSGTSNAMFRLGDRLSVRLPRHEASSTQVAREATSLPRLAPLLDVEVPAERLASVSFVMGLPPALNVSGSFSTGPEALMEWPEMMGGGYHFMKFEGRYINDASEPFNFRAHTGGLHDVDYSFDVVLDAGNRPLPEGAATLTVVMNLEQWFTAPHEWDLNDYFTAAMPGIMANAAAQESLQDNGATVFSLETP